MTIIGEFIGSCIAAYYQPEKKYKHYFPDDLLTEIFSKLSASEQASNNLALVCRQFYYISKKARQEWNKELILKIDYISQSINDSYEEVIEQQVGNVPWWDREALIARVSSLSADRKFFIGFSHGRTEIAYSCNDEVPKEPKIPDRISFELGEKVRGYHGLTGLGIFRDNLSVLFLSPTAPQEEKWIAEKVIQKVNNRWF